MNESSLQWNDLNVILAIAEGASLVGATRLLGSSHTTVFRQLNRIEQKLGVKLFDRSRTGYTSTAAGVDLVTTALAVREQIQGVERRLLGRDLMLSGVIRITTTDTLIMGLLSPILASFSRINPDIELEVVVSNQVMNITRRDADIAIRPSSQPSETLVGRRIGSISQAIYACVGKQPDVADLAKASWVGPDARMGYTALEKWMMDSGADARCRYRVDTVLGMLQGIRDGMGVGVLPCYLADRQSDLVRISDVLGELATDLWMLTHPDLRRAARIRAFFDYVIPELRVAGAPQIERPR